MNISNALKHSVFLRKKPLVSIKVASGYARAMVFRQPVLRTVDFAVTNVCNSKCRFCSAHLLYKSEKRTILTPDQIVDAFKQASRLGAMHINLTGGEPMTRNIDELCYIARGIRPRFHLLSLVTNSLSITAEKLKRLKQSGLDTLQLSIESMSPDVHDHLRGIPGNWEEVMKAFAYAQELGLIVCLSTVLTRTNFSEIRKIIEFASRHRNVFVLLNPISSCGAVAGESRHRLTLEDMAEYEELLKIGIVRADTIVNFSGRAGCPGGKERIHITAFGDVMTCPHVQISYGNIKHEPLRQIWERMYSLPDLKRYSPVCKHAFDQAYYDKVLKPIEHMTEVPVSVFAHPTLKHEISRDDRHSNA
ncbi:MAG: radical SAM protein [bacterium]